MNLSDMLSDLYSFFRYTTTPPAAVTTRLTRYLNDTQRELLTRPGLSKLRDDVVAVTATANTARSGLPPSVNRINGITDRTNNRKLRQVTLDELRIANPSQSDTSTAPERYAVVGYVEVQLQPTAATGLWAVSSSTSDTTQTAYIETFTTGGYAYRDTKALNGQTRVQFGATATRTDHIEVTRFYIGATAVGYISLYDAATNGNELARIEPGKTFARYLAVEWHPIASATATFYADITRTITNLVNSYDEPLIPDDFHLVVVNGAMVKECLFINDARYGAVAAEYEKGQRALTSWVMHNPDRVTSLRRIIRGRSSLVDSVGSGYPADTWY